MNTENTSVNGVREGSSEDGAVVNRISWFTTHLLLH